jgi:hypothetical protein
MNKLNGLKAKVGGGGGGAGGVESGGADGNIREKKV